MKLFIIIMLACVWIGLAWNAHASGNNGMAGLFIIIGVALTTARLLRRSTGG